MATKPTRDKFPKGLLGNRKYQLALEAYNRGIQKPKPKPTNDGRRPNTYPTAAEVRGRANSTSKTTKPQPKVAPNVPYGPGGSATGSGLGQAQQNPLSPQQRMQMVQPAPRSPAVSAPIHAAPKAFGSAYAPQAGAAPRPNTPQPASAAPNPFAPIGDVRGQAMGSTQVDPNAALTAGTQQYSGQKLQGIDENGVDMERRRAFLDANDSMSGMKAVQNLLNKRKLSISVSD